MNTPPYYEKAYGLFFGGALGDSIGLGTEFLTRDIIEKFYGDKYFKYSEFYPDEFRTWWKPGDWTDDTNQMIIICKIIKNYGIKVLKNKTDKEIQCIFAQHLTHWRSSGHSEHIIGHIRQHKGDAFQSRLTVHHGFLPANQTDQSGQAKACHPTKR